MRKQLLEEQRQRAEELKRQANLQKQRAMAERSANRGTPIPTEDLNERYDSERTVEKIQLHKILLTRTVINIDGVITFYTRVEHDNGSIYHFKNGEFITAWQYREETKR